ncbi:hypothetical protein [Namhaeicola litoreus]|uniref:Uncharacterized protein n=1 Tax=Namhaeicola litoreus TaxID=1052145 RepID=A0ABW3XYU6_9FLAO
MKKFTKFQWITITLWIIYVVWELMVWIWAKSLPPSDPVIRADLLFIYPILAMFSGISVWQFLKSK